MRKVRKPGLRAQKNKFSRQILALVLALALITSVVPIMPGMNAVAADAFAGHTVQPILLVSGQGIIADGAYTAGNISQERSYTMEELQALEEITQLYSAINTTPTRSIFLGKGISVEKLLQTSGVEAANFGSYAIDIVAKDGYTVKFDPTKTGQSDTRGKPLKTPAFNADRYYYPNIKELAVDLVDNQYTYSNETAAAAGGTAAKTMLAWERGGDRGKPDIIPTDTAALFEDEKPLLLMMGQQNVWEQNNPLFNKTVSKIVVGSALTAPVITIDGKAKTRGELLMMERGDRAYTYNTQKGETTDYARGVPLSVLLAGHGSDEIVSFTTADKFDMTSASVTVAQAIANNYLLAYEKGTQADNLAGIYDTAKNDPSIKGYFTLYGDGIKPSKLIDSISVAPSGYIDFSQSAYKHINNGGLTGSAPYNIDAITGSTLTVEGPGLETTTPIRMGDLEATANDNLHRGVYSDARNGTAAEYSYEGAKVLAIINGLVNNNVKKIDDNVRIIFKNRWRQDVGSISYGDLANAKTPVILAYGTAKTDGSGAAPFVFDGGLGYKPELGNNDGCIKLVYDRTEFPSLSAVEKFVSVAYIYVERGGEVPGFKHIDATDDAYKNTANLQHLITFTGSALGYEVNYTVEELEQLVEYGTDGLPKAGGLGHRDEYNLSNTTYWYVNKYEGIKLWDLLTTKLGVNAETYAQDENTLVSFAAWDNYQTTAKFSMAQLADPTRFYFYEKSPLDIGTSRPSKQQLANEDYWPDNQNPAEWTTDSNGYPVKKGYPVMLAYGVNGYPYVRDSKLPGFAGGLGNDGGPIRVIFGKTDGLNRSNPEALENYAYFYNNGSNQLQRAQEIYIGDSTRYSTHLENPHYTAMKDMLGLTVEIKQGGTTTSKTYTLGQLESILYGAGVSKSDREKQGRQEKGYYAHKVYNDSLLEDLFEGVNLWYLLSEEIGMQGVLGSVSFYAGNEENSTLVVPLAELREKGFNSLRNTSGLGSMVAFAKNGYPMVLDSKANGYIAKHSTTNKTIKNGDGPLMFVQAQSEAQKASGSPGATVKNLSKIVVDLEADVYAHAGDYAAYAGNEVAFSGAVKNEGVTLNVADIEKMQRFMVTGTYTIDGVERTYRGIDLAKMLSSASVGASALLNQVVVSNGTDSKTVTVAEMNSASKPIILAYGIGKQGGDPAGKPLVPNSESSGYDAAYLNNGGPLKLLINGATSADCIENVNSIAVTASQLSGWTHSSGHYAAYKNNTLSLSGSNLAKSVTMTVEELESLSNTYKVFDQYKMSNYLYFEGIDLLKLFRDHIGFAGGLNSSAFTVYANDNYAITFTASDLLNGVNGKPIILAYGQGVSANNGLPLVGGDDQNDLKAGFDSAIGNAFGPLRLVVNDNSGWCNKWVSSIVVGSATGGGEQPAAADFILVNGKEATDYGIKNIKSITAGAGGKATANYQYTTNDQLKTDYVKGIYLSDLLTAAGIAGAQTKVTVNTTDGFEAKQASYRDIPLADISSKNYFLAYDAGTSADNMAAIADTDKNNVKATVRIYRNYDNGSSWLNRLTNIKGITISGADINYTFEVYAGSGKANELPLASIRDVAVDAGGGMWVGTNGGGAWYKPKDADKFTINTLSSQGYKLDSDVVQGIAADSSGGIWFSQGKTYNPAQAHLNKGVAYLKDGNITYYNTTVADTIPHDYVQEVQIDGDGNVWFGSFGGLTKYNPSTKTWTSWNQNYQDSDGDSFPALSVDNIHFDGKGGVWLGFYPNGAGNEASPFVGGFAHMTAAGNITPYQFTAEYDSALGSSLLAQVWVRDIAIDKDGGAWVVASGSYADLPNVGGTLWYVDKNGQTTKYTGKELLGSGALTGNHEIRKLKIDGEGGLWLATSGDGLFYIAKPGKTAPLTITSQYSGANNAWLDTPQFNNIYVLNIIGDKMYLGSDAGVMVAAMKDLVVAAEPAVVESFTISGVGLADVAYYVGGSNAKTFKGLADNAGKVAASYPYDGQTHYVKGALLSTLLADAGVEANTKITIKTSDNYSKPSYENIPYADIAGKNYFVAYDVGEGSETLVKVADVDKNNVTASFRIYRNLDSGASGDKDNRIKGVVGIAVSAASSGGGGEQPPAKYDLTVNGNGVNNVAQFTVKSLKNAPGLVKQTKTYHWLNSYGTTGSDEFEGVYLDNLLQDVVGLTSRAQSITVTAGDGYNRSFNLDSSPLGVYWTDIEGNKMMLAWKRNDSNCDLQLVVGQTDGAHVNKPMWVSGIETITVNATSTSSGSGTSGKYEGKKDDDNKDNASTGSTPVTETVTEKVKSPPSISGGTASSSVSTNEIKKAIEAINKNKPADGNAQRAILEIDSTSSGQAANAGEVNQAQVTLTADTLKALANQNNIAVSINTDLGIVVLPPEAVQQLGSNSGQPIVISITRSSSEQPGSTNSQQIGDRPVVDITISQGNQQISSLGGRQIRAGIAYAAQNNENQGQLLAYYINDQGESKPVKLSRFDGESNQMLFATVHLSLYAVGYNDVTFADIQKHWAQNNIEFLAAREIIKGKADGVFDPDGKVTRAEFVTMLANSLDGISTAGAKSAGFDDVAAAAWYADFVNWAVEKKIVSGYGDGNFGPNDLITREQMAVMTDKFLAAMQADLNTVKTAAVFTDQSKINSWAASAVKKMQQTGIINGRPDGSFAPQGTSTRAEAATMIKGYIEALLK